MQKYIIVNELDKHSKVTIIHTSDDVIKRGSVMIMKSNTISPEVEKLLSSRSMIAWAVFIVVGAVVALSRLFSHIEMMSIVPHIFGFYALGCCGFVLLYTDIVDPKSGKYYGKNPCISDELKDRIAEESNAICYKAIKYGLIWPYWLYPHK
jgi:hypothetical protein